MHDDERRIIHVWHEAKHVQTTSFTAGDDWTAIDGTPLRARDAGAGIEVDVAGVEPVDILVFGDGLFVPMERPVLLGQHAILLVGPGACGTWALQFWFEKEYGFAQEHLDPIRVARDPDASRPRPRPSFDDDTQVDAVYVPIAMPDGRRFVASPHPLTDDDVCAWVDGSGAPPPLRWANRRGPGVAVGLDAAEAAACAHFHGGRLPTEEEWEALAATPSTHIGDAWEWTSTERKGGGHVVRGGRYRDRRDARGTVASRAWENEGARDVVVRIVRDLRG